MENELNELQDKVNHLEYEIEKLKSELQEKDDEIQELKCQSNRIDIDVRLIKTEDGYSAEDEEIEVFSESSASKAISLALVTNLINMGLLRLKINGHDLEDTNDLLANDEDLELDKYL